MMVGENISKMRRSGTPQPLRTTRECIVSPTRLRSMTPDDSSRVVQPTIRIDSLVFKAAAERKLEAVHFLLNQARLLGKDANMIMPEWDVATKVKLGPMSLLARACFVGDMAMASLAHSLGASIDLNNGLAMRAAIAGCQTESVRFLLEKGASFPDLASQALQDPLEMAADSGDYELIHLLITNGADNPAECGIFHRILVVAASKGHMELVAYLLDLPTHPEQKPPHLNIESQIGSAVQAATSNRHWTVVRLLLDRIHDPRPQLSGGESDISEDLSDVDSSLALNLPNPAPCELNKQLAA
ncbi:hypothetical protein DSO57_1024928 [Entomophthora muscae]|uniref:Uncharacterized protein n=1 Tax=Entomophthora muscae TaxID=34485 RepID=A0ACC2TDL2_9FUNG|nr:hypothetical protein DSO57_1024928 [Entomophthora muscae]